MEGHEEKECGKESGAGKSGDKELDTAGHRGNRKKKIRLANSGRDWKKGRVLGKSVQPLKREAWQWSQGYTATSHLR